MTNEEFLAKWEAAEKKHESPFEIYRGSVDIHNLVGNLMLKTIKEIYGEGILVYHKDKKVVVHPGEANEKEEADANNAAYRRDPHRMSFSAATTARITTPPVTL